MTSTPDVPSPIPHPAEAAAEASPFRVLRYRDPHAALGRAVLQLMGKPGFARLKFGSWSRVLVGQINRNHYFFLERDGETVGLAGWSRSSEARADAWVAGEGDLSAEEAMSGECIIVNVWQSNDAEAQSEMVRQMRLAAHDATIVYGRRSYGDGRDRFIKMPMSRFLARHIARGASRKTAVANPQEDAKPDPR